MAIKDFLKAALRTAIAIFLALAALLGMVAIYTQVKESSEKDAAKPFEEVRRWQSDLTDRIGLDVHVRTKLVAGRLLVSIDIEGYPKYLSSPRNREGKLNFEFLDKDGFKVSTHSIHVSEFTTVIGKSGENSGLRHQYDQYIELDRYKQFNRLQVGWNLLTEDLEAPVIKKPLDHCAQNLSRAERLKRLEQHGTVREAGVGEYTAGNRSITFFYDGLLINCR